VMPKYRRMPPLTVARNPPSLPLTLAADQRPLRPITPTRHPRLLQNAAMPWPRTLAAGAKGSALP